MRRVTIQISLSYTIVFRRTIVYSQFQSTSAMVIKLFYNFQVTCIVISKRKRNWMRRRRVGISSTHVGHSNISMRIMCSTETLSQKTFFQTRTLTLNCVTSDGVLRISTSREKHSVEPMSIWPPRSSPIQPTTTPLTFGQWVFCCMSFCMAMLHSRERSTKTSQPTSRQVR